MNSDIDEIDRRSSAEESLEIPMDNISDIYQLREVGHRLPKQDESTTSQKSRNFEVFCKNVAAFRKELYHLVTSRELEGFITFCIVANTVVMATEHYGMSSTLETIISVSNYVSIIHECNKRLPSLHC